jgi:hypothetical protein
MDILQVKSNVVLVYAQDMIPTGALMTETTARSIEGEYAAPRVPTSPQPGINSIVFAGGSFRRQSLTTPIERIEINQRIIGVTVWGGTDVAEALIMQLTKLIASQAGFGSVLLDATPIIRIHESHYFVRFDFDLARLFSSTVLVDVGSKLKEKLPNNGAKIVVEPFGVKFQVHYRDVPEPIQRSGISLADKTFTIERRETTDPTENQYYSFFPSDTGTHLEFLKWLEREYHP